MKKFNVEKAIFWPSAIVLFGMILYGFVFNDQFNSLMTYLFSLVTNWSGWFMCLMSLVLIVVCIVVCFTPIGDKKVGGPDAKIEHSTFSWCAMSICSGIATAVVFYAVGEPIGYFHNPPAWWGVEPQSALAATRAVTQSAFHWGYIYYGQFTFWGLVVGYMVMNHKLPARPSSALYPLWKDKIFGWQGKLVDVLSLLALIGGMITSLGFGVQQFAQGLDFVFGIKPTNLIYAVTLLVVICSFTVSSGRGVKKGMAIISNLNAYIYIFLICFLFLAGNTVFEFKLLAEAIGETLTDFIPNITRLDPFDVGNGWYANNTVFFMAWIMAYAPLIGLFLAKISRGRTWRQYTIVNVLVPGTFVLFWFTSFGGNAIYQDAFNGATIGAQVAEHGIPIATYALLQTMPLKGITIPIVVACLFFSFITLADAMTGVIATMTVKNITEDEAPVWSKILWGALTGAATFLCLFCLGSSGTASLQNMSIVYGLPIFIITLITCFALIKMVNGSVDREFEGFTEEQRKKLSEGIPIGNYPEKKKSAE